MRNILTLGRVPQELLNTAAALWRADTLNDPPSSGQSVLLLADQEGTAPAEYIRTLQAIDTAGSPVGIIPVSRNSPTREQLTRLLAQDTLRIDVARIRCRLTECPEANLPSAPPVLRRAGHDDPRSASADLDADLLVLQGHAGPVDAGFGRWLTLCSRARHRPDDAPVFPCFGTTRCFRQPSHGRTPHSTAGLVDPAALTCPLLILDGCGTFPVPGSVFRYEAGLARALMDSSVSAAVLTHGVSASPLSALITFLGTLADGHGLGTAVREANLHMHDVGSPTSLDGTAVAPWAVLGNPELKVVGLPLLRATLHPTETGAACALPTERLDPRYGGLVALDGLPARSGPFDLTCRDGRWARGALRADGRAHLWISGSDAPSTPATSRPVEVVLAPRPKDPTAAWRRRAAWIQANRALLGRMAETYAERGGAEDFLPTLISLWDDVSGAVERVAFAATPLRHPSLAPPLTSSTAPLTARIRELDRATARTLAAAVPVIGARLFRLWSPPWPSAGRAHVTEACSCGCPLAGDVRRHPLLGLARIGLRCPACGPVGDVCAQRSGAERYGSPQEPGAEGYGSAQESGAEEYGSAQESGAEGAEGAEGYVPTVLGGPRQRSVAAGATARWHIRRLSRERSDGFAGAALFDPFRQRQLVMDAAEVRPRSAVDLAVAIPEDWPPGLSQAVVVVTAGAELSFLDFDLMVTPGPPNPPAHPLPHHRTHPGSPPPSPTPSTMLRDRPHTDGALPP
ncbi:hypothetical protein [Streptomyces sp. NPDC020742]|uniref:hypothetical protein n=1 Tax=Streptomyces sp. NPDC020742 TaxID=3154897 RepID=UPI0033F5BECE